MPRGTEPGGAVTAYDKNVICIFRVQYSTTKLLEPSVPARKSAAATSAHKLRHIALAQAKSQLWLWCGATSATSRNYLKDGPWDGQTSIVSYYN